MNNNLSRILFLSILFIFNSISVSFAVVAYKPTKLEMIGMVANTILIILLSLLTIAYIILLKVSKRDGKKEVYQRKLETLSYYILMCIVLIFGNPIIVSDEFLIGCIIPFIFLAESLYIRWIKKDAEKSFTVLFSFLFIGILSYILVGGINILF